MMNAIAAWFAKYILHCSTNHEAVYSIVYTTLIQLVVIIKMWRWSFSRTRSFGSADNSITCLNAPRHATPRHANNNITLPDHQRSAFADSTAVVCFQNLIISRLCSAALSKKRDILISGD